MRIVQIIAFFFFIGYTISCEKNDVLKVWEEFQDTNKATCREPLTKSVTAGETSVQNCGLYAAWNISKIAERFRGPAYINLDVNGDSLQDFQISLTDNSSPGGSSYKSIFSVLNPEFSFGVIPVTYHRCTLGNFYYDQNGVITNFITNQIGNCASFSKEERARVDTVYESISVDNYLRPLEKGDTIDGNIHWDETPTIIIRSIFETGVWPAHAFVAVRRIKSNGQIEYGWIKLGVSGAVGKVFESWIQND